MFFNFWDFHLFFISDDAMSLFLKFGSVLISLKVKPRSFKEVCLH